MAAFLFRQWREYPVIRSAPPGLVRGRRTWRGVETEAGPWVVQWVQPGHQSNPAKEHNDEDYEEQRDESA